MKILDVLNSPWAIMPDKLNEIMSIYDRHLKRDKLSKEEISALTGGGNNSNRDYSVINGVAIVSLEGVIAKKMNLFMQISGGVSTQLFVRDYLQALDDPEVNSIIVHVDSPGGTVDGTSDAARVIYESRGKKPTATFIDGLGASAAIWIGTATDKVYIANDTTAAGSIGVVATHVDYSEYDKQRGIKVTEIYAGKYKRINSDSKPLSKEGKAVIQAEVDYLYSIFVNTIAKHRGESVQTVLDNMADGKIFIGQQAIDAGLVDGETTISALVESLSRGEYPDNESLQASESRRSSVVIDPVINNISAGDAERTVETLETETIIKREKPMEKSKESAEVKITKGYVLENYPEIAEAFRAEGRESVDVEQIKQDARQAETDRVKAVFDKSYPGHEKLVMDMALDGKTTGPEAAEAVLKAEMENTVKLGSDISTDAAELSEVDSMALDDVTSGASATKGPETWRKEWENSAELQKEFHTADSYISWKEVEEKNQRKKSA